MKPQGERTRQWGTLLSKANRESIFEFGFLHWMDMQTRGNAILLYCFSAVIAEAAEQAIVMDIEGMTWILWPITVKKSLEGIKGVRSVKVSFEEKKAWLTAEESVTDDMLLTAVQKAESNPRKAGSYKGRVIERKPLKWKGNR